MSFRPDPRVPFLLTAALCLAPALAEAQPGFTITPKATTSAQPAITGSPGKVAPNLPKIPAPSGKTVAPKPSGKPPVAQRPASPSGRGPTGLPERFTAGQELRNKENAAGGVADRFGTGPSGAAKPRAGDRAGKRKPGSGGNPYGPGSRSEVFDAARRGGGSGDDAGTPGADGAGGDSGGGNGNPIRGMRNARISDGDHVWGSMDFDEAHATFLGSPGYIREADGRGVRISAGVDGDTNWVSVQVSDPNSGELRRYEYENGSLVQTETTKPSGNKVVQKTDPATGQTQTTTICVADDCTDTRVNPDAVPRGTPPPAAADDDGPEPPTRLDTLVQWGPDGGLPDIQIDPESVPDPDGQLINPTRDGSPPRGEGVAGEGDPSAVRNDPLIQWVPGNEPHDDPPPASPASSSGTKGPAGGRDRGGDDGGKASAKGGKQGKSEARRERPNRGAPGR